MAMLQVNSNHKCTADTRKLQKKEVYKISTTQKHAAEETGWCNILPAMHMACGTAAHPQCPCTLALTLYSHVWVIEFWGVANVYV